MHDIKLIVCDLDGTLLKDDKTVSEYTISVLEKCQQKGLKFAVATARSSYWVKGLESFLKPDIWIVDGGCFAFCEGKMPYSKVLSLESTNAVLKEIVNADGVEKITAESLNACFLNQPISKSLYAQQLMAQGATVIETDFLTPLTHPVHKIGAEIPFDEALKIAQKMQNIHVLKYSGEKWVRFSAQKATKWDALSAVVDHFGLEAKNILAFGDDFNDITMLKNAGVGVAVGNAINEAKQAADYVCDSNENDGVARWLAKNLL